MRLLSFIFGLLVITLPASAQDTADQPGAYVADDLYVFMHSGPGRNYRIVGSIEAGLPVTILGRSDDGSYTQIQDEEEREGWIETQFLINTISRRAQLPELSQRVAERDQQVSALTAKQQKLQQQLVEAKQQISELESDQAQAQQRIQQLTAQIQSQDNEELYRMFTYGGIVAGAGVLLGIIVTFIPKRRRRNDTWM
ncbi:TIGR04211 family SH3 domain-containing protein [Alteromonas sp. AMM-1]|uniref:TIGR04211 family SH3 domain-containing protein n=1 Tax=Alteromonas sp. AMM-1 TaxID=3394233 RepID=UPI0039A6BDC1